MFLLVAAEQLRTLVRRQGETSRPPNADRSNREATQLKPLAPVAVDIEVPKGTRYQLLRALRAMNAGEFMLVEHRIPNLAAYFENARLQTEWASLLRKTSSWQDQKEIEPVLVPGTAYASVIGRIMIRAGWCAPSDQPHWVPNLRFFFLTEVGRKSFQDAQAWWTELTTLERMRLMLFE